MCQKKANKIKLKLKKKLKTSKELHKSSPLREKAALWMTKHWVLALVFRAVILLLYDCSNTECLFILLRSVEESIYSCGIPVLVHHDTGLCYWKWSWLIYRQQDEWLTHPIRTRSTILDRKNQKEKRSLEMHGKVLKTKKMEKSPFEFNCPHLQTSKWSKEQVKVSFVLHDIVDVPIQITKVVIHHRWTLIGT